MCVNINNNYAISYLLNMEKLQLDCNITKTRMIEAFELAIYMPFCKYSTILVDFAKYNSLVKWIPLLEHCSSVMRYY
jgi:hypothetical protein